MLSHEACPICRGGADLYDSGTVEPKAFFSRPGTYFITSGDKKERLSLYRCRGCGHGFSPVTFSDEWLVDWYRQSPEDTTFLAEEVGRRKTARVILQRIEALSGRRGSLLDIGCGPGFFLAEAREAGWNAAGVDPAIWAIEHAKKKLGIADVWLGGVESTLSLFPPNTFDVVTAFDVIEHVVDPSALVVNATRVLRPGGWLVVTTPRFDSWLSVLMGRKYFFIFPQHLHYFSRLSLMRLLAAHGLLVSRERTHTRHLSIGYVCQRFTKYLGVPLVQLPISLVVPFNVGDMFEVYAQKL